MKWQRDDSAEIFFGFGCMAITKEAFELGNLNLEHRVLVNKPVCFA
jgi:hypothetical protein